MIIPCSISLVVVIIAGVIGIALILNAKKGKDPGNANVEEETQSDSAQDPAKAGMDAADCKYKTRVCSKPGAKQCPLWACPLGYIDTGATWGKTGDNDIDKKQCTKSVECKGYVTSAIKAYPKPVSFPRPKNPTVDDVKRLASQLNACDDTGWPKSQCETLEWLKGPCGETAIKWHNPISYLECISKFLNVTMPERRPCVSIPCQW